LLDIASLAAELDINRSRDGNVIFVTGRLTAEVTQECVVTLDPVENRVEDMIDERFVRATETPSKLDITEEDEFDEPLEG
ncbi:phosphodiesterase, partial [Enterococcus hirae]